MQIQLSVYNNTDSFEILSINNSLCTQESKRDNNVTKNIALQDILATLYTLYTRNSQLFF
jgi:hypothetical protein